MELLKWIGAIILSLIALSLAGSVLVTILTISAIMAGATIAGFIIYAVALFIREYFKPPPEAEDL